MLPIETVKKSFQFIYNKHKEHFKFKPKAETPYMNSLNSSYKKGLNRGLRSTIKHDFEDNILPLFEKTSNENIESIGKLLLQIKELIK